MPWISGIFIPDLCPTTITEFSTMIRELSMFTQVEAKKFDQNARKAVASYFEMYQTLTQVAPDLYNLTTLQENFSRIKMGLNEWFYKAYQTPYGDSAYDFINEREQQEHEAIVTQYSTQVRRAWGMVLVIQDLMSREVHPTH